jgi:hypothetical protein
MTHVDRTDIIRCQACSRAIKNAAGIVGFTYSTSAPTATSLPAAT